MELSEAKEMISDEIANICDEDLSEAWYTVLKALDNNIPKEKIEKKIEDYSERIRYIDDNNFVQDDIYREYIKICDVLQELLGDD